MAMLMIRCRRTGRAVPTGFEVDRASFESSHFSNNTLSSCPACGRSHTWSGSDAFLGAEHRADLFTAAITDDTVTIKLRENIDEVHIPYICPRCEALFGSEYLLDTAAPPLTMSGTARCPECGAIASSAQRLEVKAADGTSLCIIESEGYRSYDLSDLNPAALRRLAVLSQGVIDGTTDPSELLEHLDTGPKAMRRLRSRFPKSDAGRIALATFCLLVVQTITPYVLDDGEPPPNPELVRILDGLVDQQEVMLDQAKQRDHDDQRQNEDDGDGVQGSDTGGALGIAAVSEDGQTADEYREGD